MAVSRRHVTLRAIATAAARKTHGVIASQAARAAAARTAGGIAQKLAHRALNAPRGIYGASRVVEDITYSFVNINAHSRCSITRARRIARREISRKT